MDINELELNLSKEDIQFLDHLLEQDNKSVARLISIITKLDPDEVEALESFATQVYS